MAMLFDDTNEAVKYLARKEVIKLLYALVKASIPLGSVENMSLKEFEELCERIVKEYAI